VFTSSTHNVAQCLKTLPVGVVVRVLDLLFHIDGIGTEKKANGGKEGVVE